MLKNFFYTVAVFFLLLPAGAVFAQTRGGGPGRSAELKNPIKQDTIGAFLTAMLDALVIIVFPFIVLAVIYAGFLFVSAQGNEEKLKTAKRVFLWVIVGSLIILGASVLSNAIQGTVDKIKSGNDKVLVIEVEDGKLLG